MVIMMIIIIIIIIIIMCKEWTQWTSIAHGQTVNNVDLQQPQNPT